MNKEIRLSEETEGMTLEGYVIAFNKETLIGDEKRGFIEVIEPTALISANMKAVPLKYFQVYMKL